MPRASTEELQKHTLNLFRGDYECLMALYPETGAGPIIRKLVRDFLDRVDVKKDEAPQVDIAL